MKRIVSLATLALLALQGLAQTDTLPRHIFGIRGGLRSNDMVFSYDGYEDYKHTRVSGTSVGLYSRHRLKDNLSLRADVMYTTRGLDMKWTDVKYTIDATYIDFRVPFQYNIRPAGWAVQPYLYGGLSADVTYAGKITYRSDMTPKSSVKLNRKNFSTWDLGLIAGVGLDIPLRIASFNSMISIEAGFDLGLLNTFATDEVDGDSPVANPELANEANYGSRKNRGLEVAAILSIPIAKPAPRKETPRRVVVRPAIVEQVAPAETVEPAKEAPEWEVRECYTLNETAKMAKDGEDICGIRVCFYDVLFAFNSAELERAASKRLTPVVDLMLQHPEIVVVINGHTDNVGSDEYNEPLSLKRAESVARYITSHGVDTSRVQYKGFGKRYPIDTNETADGRKHNRRVEIEFRCKTDR